MNGRLVFHNSAWLIADKLIRLGLGLVVWLWLARQIGPGAFGQWSFAMAFAALFAVIAGLGFDGVLQRELAAPGANVCTLLGTAALLRLGFGAGAAALCVVSAWSLRREPQVVLLVACNAAVFLPQSALVVDYLFQARMKNRPAVLALNVAFFSATVVRLALLALEAPLVAFGATLLLEAALAAALLLRAARGNGASIGRWRYDAATARRLLRESWPLMLSGIAVIVYMRIDQVMLAALVGDEAVGQFSAALRLSEVWYFIPAAILSAAFPALLARRNLGGDTYERFLQHLYDLTAWMGMAVAVFVTFTGAYLVELLYGPAYAEAARVLQIQIWAGIAVAMSYVHGKWLLAEGLQRLGLVYTLIGCVANLALNALLIPRYGAVGAAYATLAAQIGVLPAQLFFSRGRPNFRMMLSAASAPLRAVQAWRGRSSRA